MAALVIGVHNKTPVAQGAGHVVVAASVLTQPVNDEHDTTRITAGPVGLID